MHPRPPGRRRLLASLAVGAAAAAAPKALEAQQYPRRAPAPTAAPRPAGDQEQPIRIMTGEIKGTFATIGSDLSNALEEPGFRVLAELSHGSLDNIKGLLNYRGVDLGLVASDTLNYAKRELRLPNLDRILYITKLYDNEVHIVARDPGILEVGHLQGRSVCADVEGSGTDVTCKAVFSKLGVRAAVVNDNPGRGLERLKKGEIDALAYVIGKPGALFRDQPPSGLHFVAVPYAAPLQDDYLPAEFTAKDYPSLVPGGERVESIGVGVVLACFGWDPGTDRYRRLVRFVEAFIRKLPEMRGQIPPYHPKWREVDPQAQAPGWPRFPPVEGLLLAAGSRPLATPPTPDSLDRFLRLLGVERPTDDDRRRALGMIQTFSLLPRSAP